MEAIRMGLTYGCIHVYSESPVIGFPEFRSFSSGWQTLMHPYDPMDPLAFPKLAKKISKATDAPVVWVLLLDEDIIHFEIYQTGKKAAVFDSISSQDCKNLYSIPGLLGYEQGGKRRISQILSCADTEEQYLLLEEFFGVCLIVLPEEWEKPETLLRARGDARYQTYLAEEKKLTGKAAPLKAQMISQQPGKLFPTLFHEKNKNGRRHHYFYGYDVPDSALKNEQLQPVRFKEGKLWPISREEFEDAPEISLSPFDKEEYISEEYYPVEKIHFNEKAPEELRNKTLLCPKGYSFFSLDQRGRVLLSNLRGGIAVADSSMKIIAKTSVKGGPIDFADGYILTVGPGSGWLYFYSPSDMIRIYQLLDSSEKTSG